MRESSDCPHQTPEPSGLVSVLSLQLALLKEDFPEYTGHIAGAQSVVVTLPGCGTTKRV